MVLRRFKGAFDIGRLRALAARLFLGGVVVCLLLGVVILIATVSGTKATGLEYATTQLRLIDEEPPITDPREADRRLFSDAAQVGYSASKQPSGEFWIGLPITGWQGTDHRRVVELRMLRGSELQFWAISSDASKAPQRLQVDNEKGGIAVWLTLHPGEKLHIVGKLRPIGVARPKIFLWNASEFDRSTMIFERGGGALLGSFIMLAIFSAIVGLINRDLSFFLFSGWLVTSLRVASINDGWDLLWLGIDLHPEMLLSLLRVSLAAHALLTVGLFRALLATELRKLRTEAWLSYLVGLFGIIVVAAIWLPHSIFLPVLWTTSAVGIAIILGSLGLIVYRTRSSVSIWYAASWGLTFSGILTEVGYASGLIPGTVPGLNSQTASVASALVTAIALAEKLRVERNARLSAQREKFEVLEKFKQNYNSMPVGLFSMNRSGEVTLFNPAFAKMFMIAEDRSDSSPICLDALIGQDPYKRLCAASDSRGDADLELQVADSEENRRWFLARVTSKTDSIEGSFQEITVRKEAESKLRHLVDHDSLTGLLNRNGLEDAMAVAADAVAHGHNCALAHVDLDRFKLVNELYGHAVGDAMLQEASSRLTRTVRTRDHVARIGDSFVVVFLDCPDQAAAGLSERLREAIGEHPFELLGKSLSMTVSIGVVSIEQDMKSVDALAAADRACSEAKARGRNCVVRLDDQDATLKTHLEELRMVADLRQRIPTDRYFLEFQPIVSLRTAAASLNYEVLIRMRDEQGGVVAPGRFIGAAERNGLMSQIDRWVLRSTLEWIDSHPEHRDRLTFATLNISGASLNDARFVDDAFSMIADHPHAMSKLCFEITESVALNDLDSTRRFVDRVRAYGSKLALDDFGAGYTSFNYLKEIPADFIKIDGSFVRDINRNPANYAITRTIVDLTHELGMRSIAEWAETADTIASLIELRVDYGQGFGLARPMAKEIVTDAPSSGALVRDPAVISMLDPSTHHLISTHPAGSRRH